VRMKMNELGWSKMGQEKRQPRLPGQAKLRQC
jgi:hypothetical protein